MTQVINGGRSWTGRKKRSINKGERERRVNFTKKIKVLIQIIKEYRKHFAILMFFSVAIYALLHVNPLLIRFLIDNIISQKKFELLLKFILLIFALNSCLILFRYISQRLNIKIGLQITSDKKKELFQKALRLHYEEVIKTDAGDLIYRINQDTHSIMTIISRIVYAIINSALSILIMSFIIFYLNPKIGFFAISLIPFYIWSSFHFSLKVGKKTNKLLKQWSKITEFLRETLSSLLPIKKISCGEEINRRHNLLCDKLINTSRDLRNVGVNASTISSIFSTVGNIFVLGYGSYLVIRGQFTIGSFVAIFTYVAQFFEPLQRLVDNIVELNQSSASCIRIYEIMMKKEEDYSKDSFGVIGKKIEFKNIRFRYNEQIIFKDTSFQLEKGKINIITGKSGAGKTSLFNLILKLLEKFDGRILIDEHEIREFNPLSLRKQIGIVEQEPFLLNETIRFNITLGGKYSEQKIRNVCERANLLKTIEGKEKKWDYLVGAKGDFLSVGEKQRLAIARAVIRGAKILLLDEPTSNLDYESRKVLYKTLNDLKDNVLVILITHNFSELSEKKINLYLVEKKRVRNVTLKELMKSSYFKSLKE